MSLRVSDAFLMLGRKGRKLWKKRAHKLLRLAGKRWKEDAPKKLIRFWDPYY